MRDKIKKADYFNEYIDFYQEWLNEDKEAKFPTEEGMALNAHGLSSKAFRILVMRYGRGDEIPSLRDTTIQTTQLLMEREKTISEVTDGELRDMHERLSLHTLYESLAFLAFMVSLHMPSANILQTINLLGHKGEDTILDRVSAMLGDISRPVAQESKFPSIYNGLSAVMSSPASQRSDSLKKFVDTWYKKIHPIYWHNSHNGGEGAYFGYWCFEAALVAMVFDIDDTQLRDHSHYPSDLTAHYRNNI